MGITAFVLALIACSGSSDPPDATSEAAIDGDAIADARADRDTSLDDADGDAAADATMPRSCPAPRAPSESERECNGEVGVPAPMPRCSADAPCNGPTGTTVDTPYSAPERCNVDDADRGTFDDGPPITWTDAVSGEPRAACVFTPEASGPVPLLVFLHGSFGSARNVYERTSLRTKAATFVLGDAPGFVLAAPQGPNLHWPGGRTFEGAHHDFFFRDLA